MMLIDTHTHLYLEDFNEDRSFMIQRALEKGVKYMLLPHIDSRSSQDMLDMARQFHENCIPMMGLHPTSVKENYREELNIIESYLENETFCAVGEVGLDYYWDTTFRQQQEEAFQYQIGLAAKYDLPLVIHTRNSLGEAIGMIKSLTTLTPEHTNTLILRGVFHCFPGTVEQAREVVEMGFYLGIGGVVTYKNALMAKVVEAIPLENLLLETDAPFLTPVPKRGMRNESSFVYYIAQKIAEIKGIDIEEVAGVTTKNAELLFNINARI